MSIKFRLSIIVFFCWSQHHVFEPALEGTIFTFPKMVGRPLNDDVERFSLDSAVFCRSMV